VAELQLINRFFKGRKEQMSTIANTPKPPYYAVIFSNTLNDDTEGYQAMAENMEVLAKQQAGFLGIESVREGLGVTVSYWADLQAIKNWKTNVEHQQAQKLGRSSWYRTYKVRVTKVERDYGF
jgi:heme-degrading monooxygenase HmoA